MAANSTSRSPKKTETVGVTVVCRFRPFNPLELSNKNDLDNPFAITELSDTVSLCLCLSLSINFSLSLRVQPQPQLQPQFGHTCLMHGKD